MKYFKVLVYLSFYLIQSNAQRLHKGTYLEEILETRTAFVLLFLATLLHVARGDTVTFKRCKERGFTFSGMRGINILPDLEATKVVLNYCGLTDIEPGDFDGLPNVESISMLKNQFRVLDGEAFVPVTGILTLDISQGKLEYLPRFGYYNLFPNMTELKLQENKIAALCHPDTFSSMEKLKVLDLSHNRIGYIHPDTFKNLKNLEQLYLGNNLIPYVSEKMLQIKSLKWISLEDNMIEHVAPDAFLGSQARTLRLYGNRLTYLPEHFLLEINKAGGNVLTIPLSNNPWQCRCLLELLEEAHHIGVQEYFSFYFLGTSPHCYTDSRIQCIRPSEEQVAASLALLDSYLINTKYQNICK